MLVSVIGLGLSLGPNAYTYVVGITSENSGFELCVLFVLQAKLNIAYLFQKVIPWSRVFISQLECFIIDACFSKWSFAKRVKRDFEQWG